MDIVSNPPATDTLRRMIVGYRLSQALHVVARLGIADRLRDGPKHVDELAHSVGAHPPTLHRLLRFLAGEGVFAETDEPGRFELTPLAEPLQRDVPGSLRNRAIFEGEEGRWRAWGRLLHSVATGDPAFDHVHGIGYFEYLQIHPAAGAEFNELMAGQSAAVTRAILEAYDFSEARMLVDVGGGHGGLLAGILAAHPAQRGFLYDLPHVVADARASLERAGVAERCQLVGGDFFQRVPEGGDAYLLKVVLHDWDDVRCGVILRNCRAAMRAGSRLLVIENLLPPPNRPGYARYLDLNMLVLIGGRERSAQEYAELFEAAGFALLRVIPTRAEVAILEARPV